MRTPYSFRKEALEELPEFDPNRTDYSERELAMYADKMLWESSSENDLRKSDYPVLMQEHAESKWRKELNVGTGTPDAAISSAASPDGQRMFNRQHPQGRKVNSSQARKIHGAGYYRG
jgi:hypothetical protein